MPQSAHEQCLLQDRCRSFAETVHTQLRLHLLRQFLAQIRLKRWALSMNSANTAPPGGGHFRHGGFTAAFEQAIRQYDQFLDLNQQTGGPRTAPAAPAVDKLPNQAGYTLPITLTGEQNLSLLNPPRLGIGSSSSAPATSGPAGRNRRKSATVAGYHSLNSG
ncbi:MAG: hypothetical protein IPL99_02450 [Candidatus Competibacteraceae bacterium]|nr:hypothetical protein [Candidatus Competibacteraceae bacterium]